MRWQHPKRGMISPAVFIPLAERFGLIGSLGNWVIDEVCRQIASWRDGGLRMRVAINLSVHQLRQPDLVERIAAALRTHGVNPGLLTCEVTESVAMEDAEAAIRIFSELTQIGAKISIEDDGSVKVAAADQDKIDAAVKWVKSITDEAEVGKVYEGKVVKVMEFGAFVNFFGAKDGLVHISQLANRKVATVGEIVKEGDTVKVKLMGFDDRGKTRLSMKVVDQATGEDIEEKLKAERAERGEVEEVEQPRERSERPRRRRD
jgi:predicted RNA-binding protein with RPS1 domain